MYRTKRRLCWEIIRHFSKIFVIFYRLITYRTALVYCLFDLEMYEKNSRISCYSTYTGFICVIITYINMKLLKKTLKSGHLNDNCKTLHYVALEVTSTDSEQWKFLLKYSSLHLQKDFSLKGKGNSCHAFTTEKPKVKNSPNYIVQCCSYFLSWKFFCVSSSEPVMTTSFNVILVAIALLLIWMWRTKL